MNIVLCIRQAVFLTYDCAISIQRNETIKTSRIYQPNVYSQINSHHFQIDWHHVIQHSNMPTNKIFGNILCCDTLTHKKNHTWECLWLCMSTYNVRQHVINADDYAHNHNHKIFCDANDSWRRTSQEYIWYAIMYSNLEVQVSKSTNHIQWISGFKSGGVSGDVCVCVCVKLLLSTLILVGLHINNALGG